MEGLIKVEKRGDKFTASARELYVFLGLEVGNWTRWAKKNIIENPFAIENVDWSCFASDSESAFILKRSGDNQDVAKGNFAKDYEVTVDFAERLAMQVRTEKGEQIRRFFQDCKNKLFEKTNAYQVPTDYEEALEQLLSTVREQKALKEQLQLAEPKIKAFETFLDGKEWYSMEETAKCLGMGRNKLYKKLREVKVIQLGNTYPYQNYIDDGAFKMIMVPKTIDGQTVYYPQPLVSPKGLERIRKRLHIEVKQLALPKGR